MFAGIGSIITLTITGYKWEGSLVKQDQFSRHEQREIKRDSLMVATFSAKIDTLDKNKVNYTDIKTSVVNNAKKPLRKTGIKEITQRTDEYGNRIYTPVY